MKSLWRYLGGTIIRPLPVFRDLEDEPKKVSKAFRAMLLVGILYTITVAMLAAGGALITAPAFIKLSPENYYFYEMFFVLPVFILGWILAAGFAHLLSRWAKGNGTYEGTLSALGLALSVPFFLTWIPETAFAILLLLGMKQEEFMELTAQPGLWQFLGFAYQGVAAAWMLVLFILAVAASQRLRWWRALLVGSLSAVLFIAFILVFIR
jgi:hypothetical protein